MRDTSVVAAYADDASLGYARSLYFEANGFCEGGYEASWVRLQAGPVPLYFPNTASRVRSVRLHDLHHVLTGYDTTWTGESEIGAWEIGSGCADHWAAWLLNFNAVAIGLAIAPQATFHAFVRGRRTRNLYGGEFEEALLGERVGDMRRRLGLDRPTEVVPGDRARFVLVSIVSVATLAAVTALTVAPMLALVFWLRA
ncbi:MAG TPA: hypothetical protein VEC57_08350 [Candidatus Limnocylindrales bacterium]|nr:hypothetical protein [Candidatus Limnocylindrales bacterium]